MKLNFFILSLILLLFVTACTSKKAVYGPVMTEEQSQQLYSKSAVKPSFTWIKENVLSICTFCHAPRKANFLSHAGTLPVVVAGEPEKSRLYQYLASGRMPKGAGKLPPEKIQAVYDWIKQGAKNN